MKTYTKTQKSIHWLTLVLLILVYITIEFRSEFERGSSNRFLMVQAHFWLGLMVLALVFPRIWQRTKHGTPPITPELPRWQALASKALHLSIYAVLIFQPILGLLTAWTDGKVLMVPLTSIEIPALLSKSELWAHRFEDVHKLVATAFYYLIGIHVLAALWHHFGRKDDTLKRMI